MRAVLRHSQKDHLAVQADIPTLASALPSLGRRHALCGLLGAALAVAGCSDAGAAGDAVSLEAARAAHEAGRVVLIDIRESSEHATGVASGARLIPMSKLGQRLTEVPKDPSRPVLLICNTQNRSSATMRALRDNGFTHVRYVSGGLSEWARRGWPMVKPGPQ